MRWNSLFEEGTFTAFNTITTPISQAVRQLYSFTKLPRGWDYGEGGPISYETLKLALSVHSLGELNDFESEALPGNDGGVTLILSLGDYFLDVYVGADNSLSTRTEKGKGEDFVVLEEIEHATKYSILGSLRSIKRWYMSEHLIEQGIVLQNRDLTKMPFHLTGEEYQYSIEPAL